MYFYFFSVVFVLQFKLFLLSIHNFYLLVVVCLVFVLFVFVDVMPFLLSVFLVLN